MNDWLKSEGLQEYQDELAKEGYDEVQFLMDANEPVIETLTTDIGMNQDYKTKLKDALRKDSTSYLKDSGDFLIKRRERLGFEESGWI